MTSMSHEILQKQFDLLGPWQTRFWVDGVAYGGQYDPSDDPRIRWFDEIAGPLAGKRVLEFGPLEGGHSLQLAKRGASVTSIEGREANYRRCLFIRDLFQLRNVEFIRGDLRTVDFKALGPFDFIFNVGVLYHLDEPWKVLTALRGVAPRMFISTHCAPRKLNTVVDAGGCRLEGSWHVEGPLEEALSGLQPRSFWPTRRHLEKMLTHTGWPSIRWMDYNPTHVNGPLATLWVGQTDPGPLRRVIQIAKARAYQ